MKRDILAVIVLVVGGLLTFGGEWLISGRQPFAGDSPGTTVVIRETPSQRAAGPTTTVKEVVATKANSRTRKANSHIPTSPATRVDLLEASALKTFTGHIANDGKCGGAEAAPNSCQLSGVTIGTSGFGAAWWTAGYDTSDSITFSLGGRFKRFTGMLGIVSASGAGCQEHMEVRGDSRQLFGETLTGARHLNLDVAGIEIVTVSADVAAQGAGDCQAGLGEPTGVT